MSKLSEHWIQDYYDLQTILLEAELITVTSSGVQEDTPSLLTTGYDSNVAVTEGSVVNFSISDYDSNKFYFVSASGSASLSGDDISWTLPYLDSTAVINSTSSVYAVDLEKTLSDPVQFSINTAPVYQETDPYTKLLLHMDGTGNSFSDSSSGNKTITTNGNAVQVQSKFGGGSGYFDGSGDYLSIPDNEDWDFGSGNFTVDFWAYLNSPESTARGFIGYGGGYAGWNSSNGHQWLCLLYESKLYFQYWSGSLNNVISTNTISISYGWHHFAFTNDNTNFTMFIDGSSVRQVPTITMTPISSPLRLVVGDIASLDTPFFGYIDELRISKGIARWTSNFTPPTSAYTGDSYTKLLLHMDGTGSSFTDSSSSPKTVTANGNAAQVQSKFGGKSGYFDGTGDYLSVQISDDFNLGNGDFTIDYWEYRTNNVTSSSIINTLTGAYCAVGYQSGGSLLFYCSSNGSSWDIVDALSMGTAVLNIWTHYTIVRNGNTFSTYQNGNFISSTTSSASVANITVSLVVGVSFIGYIDELRISKGIARWTSNFTPLNHPYSSNPTKLLLHMDGADNGTSFVDSSESQKTVTRYGSVTKIDHTKFGTASAFFDGVDDYLDISNSTDFRFGTSDFTVDFWIRTSVKTLDTYYRRLFMLDGPTGNATNNFQIAIVPTSGYINVWSTSGSLDFNGTTDVADNVWHHIAVTRTSGLVKLYVGGTYQSSQSWNVDINLANTRPRIGAYTSANGRFSGYMEELRISNGVARWTSNFTPPVVAYNL